MARPRLCLIAVGAWATMPAMLEDSTPPAPVLAKSDQNLVWLDCEMSGLEPDTDRLLEIAVVVTGPQLEPRIEGPVFAIHQKMRM